MEQKTFSLKTSFFLLFIFSSVLLYPDSYDRAVELLENKNTEKSLTYFYKYLESDSDNQDKIITSLQNIILHEKVTEKIISSVKEYSKKITIRKKVKSEILLKAAEIAELSGKTEDAADFYISSYNEYPNPSNSSSLLISARLLIDNGEFVKAEKQIIFYKSLPLDNNSLYRAEIIESLLKILKGEKPSGERHLSEILNNNDISEENLAAIILLVHNYNLDNLLEISKKRLIEKDENADVSSIFSANSMISPAVYFNFSNLTQDIKQPDTSTENNENIFLQTGSYSNRKNAENMSGRVSEIGFKNIIIKDTYKGKIIYKVLIPAESKEKAQKYHISLKEHSIESFLIFK